MANSTCRALFEGHADAVGAVGISRRTSTYDSKAAVVISGGSDKILKRWSLQGLLRSKTNEFLSCSASHSVRAHDKDINCVAIAPNDSIVASASQDKAIRLWSTADLSAIANLKGHKRGVWKICFSNVDKCLASCSSDRTLKLWSVVDFTCLHTFEGHTASVLAVKFINHGQQLMSSSSDGLIRLWTIRSGECVNTFDEHENRIWALAVQGSQLISGDSDGKIVIWQDKTEEEENLRLVELEKSLLMEQQLKNDLKNKRYDKVS